MNINVCFWFPVAALAWTLTSTADAEGPVPSPATSTAGVTDLCAELDEFGHPARCEPVGTGTAPYWDAEVCCDDRTCFEPGSSGCANDLDLYWCGSAELHGDGTLTCVYEVPDYCDMFPCGPGDITAPPLEHAICCYEVCYDPEGGPCGGEILFCHNGVSNLDGTVTCLDGED